MTIDVDEYRAIQKQLKEQQREKDRAEAVLEQLHETLRKDHNCKNIKQAERLLEKRKKTLEEKEEEFAHLLQEFTEKYDTKLR